MAKERDPDLAQGLKQAKKKPRNFVLLAKGTSVVKLLVDKKPIKDGEVQKAKAEFKANLVLRGIVKGDGSDFIFQVAGEEPTIKIPDFRDYIAEQTELKVKLRFEVVKEIQEIDDSGDEIEGGETESQQAGTSSSSETTSSESTTTTTESTTTDELAELIAKMKSLAPHVQTAILRAPSQKDALLLQVAEFQKQAKAGNAELAKAALTALAQLLKQGGATQPGGKPGGTASVPPDFWPQWDKAKLAWRDALDTVNDQLSKLRTQLLKEEDSELKQIAEFGLNAITSDHKVPLQGAIIGVDEARNGDPRPAMAKLLEMVVDFRDHIDTDERVEACDDNPFDVKVSICATLDPALAQLEQTAGLLS